MNCYLTYNQYIVSILTTLCLVLDIQPYTVACVSQVSIYEKCVGCEDTANSI